MTATGRNQHGDTEPRSRTTGRAGRVRGRQAVGLLSLTAVTFSLCLSVSPCLRVDSSPLGAPAAVVRVNQVGYLPHEPKIAIAETRAEMQGRPFAVVAAADPDQVYFTGALDRDRGAFGAYAHHYPLDFSSLTRPGVYRLIVDDPTPSPPPPNRCR